MCTQGHQKRRNQVNTKISIQKQKCIVSVITSRFLASKNNNATTSGKFLGWSFVGIKQIPQGIMVYNPSAPDLENTSAPSAETVPDFLFYRSTPPGSTR